MTPGKSRTTFAEDPAAATTGASVLGGGVWQAASRMLPQVYTLVISIAIARFLGIDDFGRQSFIAFVAIAATSFFSGGLKVGVMRYVGELLGRRDELGLRRLVVWSGSIQLTGAALGGLALVIPGVLGAAPPAAWILAGVWVALACAQTLPNSVLIGAQRFRLTATIGMVTDTIAVPSTIAVLAAGGGIAGVFAVEAGVAALNLVLTAVYARRFMAGLKMSPARDRSTSGRYRGPFLRFAALSTAGVVLELIVWRRSEFFFLEVYSTDAEIGLYSVAFAAAYALALIPQTLAGVIAPAFATLFGAGQGERLRSGYGRGMRLLLLVSLPLTASAVALGPEAIRVLYGESFERAGPVLIVLVALLPLLPLYAVSQSLLIGLGRIVFPFLLGMIAAAVNIALDFVLIPGLEAIGAALANAAAQLVIMIPVVVYTGRLVGRVEFHPGALGRAAAASAIAGAMAWGALEAIGGVAGLLAGGAVGVLAFTALALALKVIPGEDAVWLEETAGQRLRGTVGWVCRNAARRPSSPGMSR